MNDKAAEAIRLARERKGWTQEAIAEKMGITVRQYNKYESGLFPKYKQEVAAEIDALLGTNIKELLYEQNVPETHEKTDLSSYLEKRRDLKNNRHGRQIPFYDAEATATLTETEMNPIHAPAGTIDVGDLLHDSQAAIRIYGNSMLPNYPPGCVVGLSKIEKGFIEPGEVYVIETKDRRLLKRLFYKDDDPDSDYLLCYSDNVMKFQGGARDGLLAYPPFNLHKKEIVSLFVVNGVIKRNSNSVIINRNI